MKNKFKIEEYDDRYYKWHYENTRNYIIPTMSWYISTYKPTSIIDWGCGIGAYLEAGYNHSILDLKGVDIGGEKVKKYTSPQIINYIEYKDCTSPIFFKEYDCVISLETGEHIETTKSYQFIKNIAHSVKAEGSIIFSAAAPNQKGTGHINCQPKEFWVDIFKEFNIKYNSSLTIEILKGWEKIGIPSYLSTNLMIFNKI